MGASRRVPAPKPPDPNGDTQMGFPVGSDESCNDTTVIAPVSDAHTIQSELLDTMRSNLRSHNQGVDAHNRTVQAKTDRLKEMTTSLGMRAEESLSRLLTNTGQQQMRQRRQSTLPLDASSNNERIQVWERLIDGHIVTGTTELIGRYSETLISDDPIFVCAEFRVEGNDVILTDENKQAAEFGPEHVKERVLTLLGELIS